MQQEQFQEFGQQVASRYRLERELGHGGMATVFLAQDLKHQRPVALKVLRQEIAAMLGEKRFRLEIEIAARLNHPNILPLYDSDEAAGTLFYVMPYVEGGTLQRLMARGARLPVAQALDIARQIAGGLMHAHARDVVHRDIKPANILVSSGHVFIADFGIARAVRQIATEERLTESGFAPGTPAYMAPEQLRGSSSVDGRADEYSLACVLYEMLTGALPPATDARGDIRRAIREVRQDVPPAVEEAIERGLAPERGARYPSVTEFAGVLDSTAATPPDLRARLQARERRLVRKVATVAILAAGAVVLSWWALTSDRSPIHLRPAAPADTTRYAILPFEQQAGVTLNAEPLLRDALDRWTGLSIVDRVQVRDAMGRDTVLTGAVAAKLARRVGAGRFIRGEVSYIGDSLRVHASLYDVAADSVVSEGTAMVGQGLGGVGAALGTLVDGLLFRGPPPPEPAGVTGKRSLPSRQALARGQQALESWDLAAAESAFTAATTYDPQYAEAQLWVALTRAWAGEDSAKFRLPAAQASIGRARLSPFDQAMSDAVLAQSRDDLGRACPMWEDLTHRAPQEYAAWYGSAYCLRHDDAVVPDRSSPSGRRFRSSYQQAVRAYTRAFQLRPAILASLRSGSFGAARSILMSASARVLRPGRGRPPDTTRYVGSPEWIGDTLVLVPYPVALVQGARSPWTPRLVNLAVSHQREAFRDVAISWATAFPQDAGAMEAVAVSLQMLGNAAALDTLRRARALAGSTGDRTRIAAAEVWELVELGAGSAPPRLHAAKALADSLLARSAAPGTQRLLAALAALTGRAQRAAALMRASDIAPSQRGPWALLIFASLGGPRDSLEALEHVVARDMADSSNHVKLAWLGRAATLAAGGWPFRSADGLRGKGSPLLDARAALAAGDTLAARRVLEGMRDAAAPFPASERAIDAVYAEAALFALLGDNRGAVAWLDATLNALPSTAPGTFDDLAEPGALVNAMVLRADLAARAGDTDSARRWAEAVATLWSDADEFLQPTVMRMRKLASS